ncbi:hypothetical protein PIB30_065256 [Stylosanthes scabra]|uniref:Uncharacterized protein n=1 Tax=Stylosanthes scabra TaxID=79078 RepID=A0ABU6SMA2_9FABA|nr:hypothetical protein [Stylosanthes scabra]
MSGVIHGLWHQGVESGRTPTLYVGDPRRTWRPIVHIQNRHDLGYDSEPERTLLRRRREATRAKQAALEQQLNMAAEHQDDNMNMDNQNRITLGKYINPTAIVVVALFEDQPFKPTTSSSSPH